MSDKVIILKLKVHDPSDLLMNETSLGLSLEQAMRKLGGKCVARWADGELTVWTQGIDSQVINQYADAYFDCMRRHGRTVTVTQVEQEAPPNFELPERYLGPGAIQRERLTRTLILTLPIGKLVVSNEYIDGRSAFAEKMEAFETRLSAWKRVKAACADQRLCQVWETEDDFIKAKSPSHGLL